MEQIFNYILTEKWFTAFLFILVLVGVYKIAKYLWSKAIDVYEKNLELQREAQNKKDLEFLKSVWEISQIIKSWDDRHEIAHERLWKKIEEWHKMIWEKLDILTKYQMKNENKNSRI